ncbi:hypothetical protein [Brevibacillus laterosporus]|uniref:Uncharacterized protein n=1 Tax=Brevibacillus laterosporus TaxID=1465 RepID=A0AAP8U740_BRELA|nr:hypothetical protein [Brevibacillus laterosporus]MED1665751.1 hypothetical protein [Brevibacillus laterosporus]MED1667160.1 hypothetical protein [Brevibacillus laterosporus]MED1719772.1 hypothetical protein [Brevibacillus laterosporus]PPB12855.1 hypothetical protein C4A77_00280 [Brevibacillus laterosporus]
MNKTIALNTYASNIQYLLPVSNVDSLNGSLWFEVKEEWLAKEAIDLPEFLSEYTYDDAEELLLQARKDNALVKFLNPITNSIIDVA